MRKGENAIPRWSWKVVSATVAAITSSARAAKSAHTPSPPTLIAAEDIKKQVRVEVLETAGAEVDTRLRLEIIAAEEERIREESAEEAVRCCFVSFHVARGMAFFCVVLFHLGEGIS